MSVHVDTILPPGWLDVFAADQRRIGIGLDPATTVKDTSNPSAIVVTQQVGLFYYARLVVRFKTDDPDVTSGLLETIAKGLRGRGLSVRRICILATNERFFAVSVKKLLKAIAPVELVIESEKINYLGAEMFVKAYLGNLFVNTIDDGYLPLPPDQFVRDDIRLVIKDRGTFDAELGPDGGHGDIFAAGGASLHALKTKGGPAIAGGTPVGTFSAPAKGPGRKLLNPYAGRYQKSGGGRLVA